jgi:hypothetical protein
MEKATVIALLEKYWQAETTIAEEQALAAYFQGPDVDPELQGYGDLFSYFHEEAQISAGPGFGNRILQRLGLPLDEEETPAAGAFETSGAPVAGRAEVPVVPMTRRPFRWGVAGAAAAIVLVVAGLFLLEPVGHRTMLADKSAITDTYDDPEQALAAVRHALLVVSKNLNQGRREITGSRK